MRTLCAAPSKPAWASSAPTAASLAAVRLPCSATWMVRSNTSAQASRDRRRHLGGDPQGRLDGSRTLDFLRFVFLGQFVGLDDPVIGRCVRIHQCQQPGFQQFPPVLDRRHLLLVRRILGAAEGESGDHLRHRAAERRLPAPLPNRRPARWRSLPSASANSVRVRLISWGVSCCVSIPRLPVLGAGSSEIRAKSAGGSDVDLMRAPPPCTSLGGQRHTKGAQSGGKCALLTWPALRRENRPRVRLLVGSGCPLL